MNGGYTRTVLVDTSAYFALFDVRDSQHLAAMSIFARAEAEGLRLFSTNFILAETHALVLARSNRASALRVLEEIWGDPATSIVRVSEEDETGARALLKRYTDKDFSLTDATSFAVMERLGLERAISFDSDFRQYGVQLLQP